MIKELNNGPLKLKVENGEIISLKVLGFEIFHNKSDIGWSHTEIEMFPIIGPSNDDYKIFNSVLDQHGILREMNYELTIQEKHKLIYEKKYIKNTKLNNSKYKSNNSNPKEIFFEYDFTFRKIIQLKENKLKIDFEIITKKETPYMLGFHPAFKLDGFNEEYIQTKKYNFKINDIYKRGNLATPVISENEIKLIKKTGFNVIIKTNNFDNFMLWSPNLNMVCIEPITFYPYSKKLENGFRKSNGLDEFSVEISFEKN